MKLPKINKIDGVNYVRRTIDTPGGSLEMQGMTVRALRQLLEKSDPDDLVCYLAEQTDETRKCDLLYGVIAGAGMADGLTLLFGPEGVWAIHDQIDNETVPSAPEPPPVNWSNVTTTNRQPLDQRPETDSSDGQHYNYLVLSADERARGFVRPYRDAYRHQACGQITTMGRALAETYARDPKFYGATYCSTCRGHFPVGERGEFTWYEMDGTEGPKVGT